MSNVHVVPRPQGKWAVKVEKSFYDSAVFEKQADATKLAHSITRLNGGGELIIHRKTGEIRQKDTIGKKDPFPPRG